MVTLAYTIIEYTKDKYYKPKKTIMIIAVIFLFSALVSVLWVRGIDKMLKEHPDYDGTDFI